MLPSLVLTLGLGACARLSGLLSPGVDLAPAEEALQAGDFDGAARAYDAALAADPARLEALVGRAYVHLLAGELDEADRRLAHAAATHADALPELDVRRALVALRRGDLDAARRFGDRSGLPAGKLFAGEVLLVDGDRDGARARLAEARGAPGEVGAAAAAYLALLDDADPRVHALADAHALWALGLRPLAVRAAEAPLAAWVATHAGDAAPLLVWAGRAAVAGEPALARRLAGAVTDPGLAWRVEVVRAHAECAEGHPDACLAGLAALEGRAPPEGLADARVTAANLLAPHEPARALALVDGQVGDAVARLRRSLGDEGAAAAAVDPVLRAALGGER